MRTSRSGGQSAHYAPEQLWEAWAPEDPTLRRLYEAVRLHCDRRFLSADDGEDTAMKVLGRYIDEYAAVRSAHGGDPAAARFESSPDEIHRIADNAARAEQLASMLDRKHRGFCSMSGHEIPLAAHAAQDQPTVEALVQGQMFLNAVAVALRTLPPEGATLFWLHYVEGHSHVDLARRYGLTPDATRMRIGRVLHRLKRLLADQGWDEPR